MPGHENWSIVSFPDHYYHLLLPKSVTDTDSAYYKGRHGAEISGKIQKYADDKPVTSGCEFNICIYSVKCKVKKTTKKTTQD